MDGPIGGRLPPRICPICGLPGGWDFAGVRGYGRAGLRGSESVRIYNDHLRNNHLAYRTWKRRLSALGVIPILILFGSLPVSIVTAPPSSGVNLWVVLVFWLAALVVGIVLIRAKGRGTRKFRDAWLQEHSEPTP